MSVRPKTAQILKTVVRKEAPRPQTAQRFVPSALQPNFVADKSNKIWSDVASQKSQILQQTQTIPKDIHVENSEITDKIAESMKSFTQLSQQ